MSNPKIAAIQMTSINDMDANLKNAGHWLEQAAQAGVAIAVLPEMFPTLAVEQGHIRAREAFGAGRIQDFLASKAREYGIWIIGGTIPLACEETERVYAACLVYNNQGECVTRYDKIHLFDANLCQGTECYKESAKTVPGRKPVVFDSPVGKIGLAVCYDLRFPELFSQLTGMGAEVLVVPSAFTYTTGIVHWEILCRARAVENLAYVVASNQTGHHSATRHSYGHSMIVNPWGTIITELQEEPGLAVSEIDLAYLAEARKTLPALTHKCSKINYL